MRDDATEYVNHRSVRVFRDDEGIQAHGRGYEPEFGDYDDDDAEPDQVEAERSYQRCGI
ncbi:hypothetical protein M2351_007161 [Azospirillum canadense]|nr:hypothetical protein [Azospirillum canadense]MCW2242505.1 hypothetical protein [Azospirillum canadense]